MVQKISEIVGVSKKSFDDAAQNAIDVAGKSVRGMKWFRVIEMEGGVKDAKITDYRTTIRLYFDYEE